MLIASGCALLRKSNLLLTALAIPWRTRPNLGMPRPDLPCHVVPLDARSTEECFQKKTFDAVFSPCLTSPGQTPPRLSRPCLAIMLAHPTALSRESAAGCFQPIPDLSAPDLTSPGPTMPRHLMLSHPTTHNVGCRLRPIARLAFACPSTSIILQCRRGFLCAPPLSKHRD